MVKVIFIGAGNLATHLSVAMQNKQYEIIQVFSRSNESASQLGQVLGVPYTTDITSVEDNAELYIFSLKDTALKETVARLKPNTALWVHTAGSVPMNIFEGYIRRYGVLYPLQTFSKTRSIDISTTPFFIEASAPEDLKLLSDIAHSLATKVTITTSEQRKYLHLSAVFACNFTNHMYAIANNILKQQGLSFDVLLPLIDETATKIHEMNPIKAQTGPAVRYDENVMQAQQELLSDSIEKEIYHLISKNIHKFSQTDHEQNKL